MPTRLPLEEAQGPRREVGCVPRLEGGGPARLQPCERRVEEDLRQAGLAQDPKRFDEGEGEGGFEKPKTCKALPEEGNTDEI